MEERYTTLGSCPGRQYQTSRYTSVAGPMESQWILWIEFMEITNFTGKDARQKKISEKTMKNTG